MDIELEEIHGKVPYQTPFQTLRSYFLKGPPLEIDLLESNALNDKSKMYSFNSCPSVGELSGTQVLWRKTHFYLCLEKRKRPNTE